MKLGAEPKKIAILGGLLALAAVALYMNLSSGDETPIAVPTPRPGAPATTGPNARGTTTRRDSRNVRAEFRPSLKRNPDDPLDVSKVDPTLRLDLMAKLQSVNMTGTGRNLFEFGAAPPPPQEAKKAPEARIMVGPPLPPAPPPVVEPTKPVAPPIPLKFYGYISTPKGAQRRGFFLDGDEIFVAAEGDTIRRRYKVVRIGLNSVEMEDLQFSQKQTLRLEEPAGGVG